MSVLKSVAVMFTDQGGPVLNEWLDLRWTHVGIKLNGQWYEATPPRVKRSNALPHRKQRTVVLWLPEEQVDKMQEYAESLLGTPYNFTGYFFPKLYGKTKGIYCSQFCEYVLRAGGLDIKFMDGYDPDRLLKAMEKLQ